jgi:hypothetical protein
MMKKKSLHIVFLFTVILSVQACFAQTSFELPQNPVLKEKEDYARYEPIMVNAAKWLEQTDLDKEPDKRKEVNAFVLKWITGSPTVNVDLSDQLGRIYGQNYQLLAIYLAGYARNMIENKNSPTKFAAIKAGLMSMIRVYKKGIQITPNKEMNKIIRLTDSELDGYINEKLLLTKSA